MNNYEKLLYKTNRQKRQLRILMAKNKLLKQKLNQLETNIEEAIEYIEKHFEEEYKKPREELKKYNLKNCTYDSGLVVLGILERGVSNE